MKKVLGVAVAILFAVPVVASAAEITGKVTSIDRSTHSFVLSDGTQLTVDDNNLVDLKEGDTVRAAYEIQDGKKVLIGLDRRAAMDGFESSNLGGYPNYGSLPSVWNEVEAAE